MEIILYQAPRPVLTSGRRMVGWAPLRPADGGTAEGQAGPVKLSGGKSFDGRRMVGWAGLLSSFRKSDKTINGAGLLSFFPRLKSKTSLRTFLVGFGDGLILLAFLGIIFSVGPMVQKELSYRLQKYRDKNLIIEEKSSSEKNGGSSEKNSGFARLLIAAGEPVADNVALSAEKLGAPDVNFSLVIPKIKAKSLVIPNVDAGKKKEYDTALKKGVAHAAGTVFPGMKGAILLFAHSTNAPWNISRYNAVFYLLKDLEKDDQIIVFFQGRKFYYKVTDKKILEPQQTSVFNQRDEEVLILQTCYPPGTTDKALLVFAKPASAAAP